MADDVSVVALPEGTPAAEPVTPPLDPVLAEQPPQVAPPQNEIPEQPAAPPAPPAAPNTPQFAVTDYAQTAGWGFSHGNLSNVRGMVIHHTSTGGDVNALINGLRSRNLSVQYAVDRDGNTYQLMPDGAKGRHMLPGWGAAGSGLGNGNMLGVEVIAKNDKDVTEAQKRAVVQLVRNNAEKYGFDPATAVFGHGEVNPGHKEVDEGMSVVNILRGNKSLVNVPAELKANFDEASAKSGVPVRVLAAIAKQESKFDPNSVNKTTGATGINNFVPGTWAEMMKTAAPVYGLPTTSSPLDARANILMGAEYARTNGQAIQAAFNRPAKDGEYYITHFLGTQGGISFIKANDTTPDAPAAGLFQKAAANNPTIFYDKTGAPRSVAQVYSFLSGVVDGTAGVSPGAGTGSIDFGKQLQTRDQHAPPLPPSQAETMSVATQMAEREKDVGFYALAGNAVGDTLTARLLSRNPDFAPDDSYRITADDLKRAQTLGVRDDRLSTLGNAVSKPHFDFLTEQALGSQQRQDDLERAGWTGTGLQVAAALLDPVAIAAGVATGGLADYAAAANGFGKLGRLAFQGVGGAAANVGLDLAASGAGDPNAGHSLLYTAALGALFGTAFGAIGRNPYVADEAARMTGAADSLRRELLGNTALSSGSLGAAGNPHATLPFLNDPEWAALHGADVPRAAYGNMRFSATGQLRASDNPGARLAGILGEDAVGGSKDSAFVVNPIATSERAAKRFAQWNTDFENTLKPAYQEWAKENDFGPLDRLTNTGRFGDLVTGYTRETDKAAKALYSPAVQRAGDKLAALQKDILELAQNPLRDEGGIGRPVQGFETVPENPNYMMRIYDARKVNEVVDPNTGFGQRGLERWFEGAIRSAQPGIENDLVEKIARGTVANVYKRANHIDERSNLMFSGFDQEELKNVLRDQGVSDKDIDNLIGRLTKDDQTGADARGKHRILLDENFRLPYTRANGEAAEIALKDFTVTDAFILSRQYFQHMAGRVELAATRIKSPTTGNMLVDGITSDNDLVAFKNRLKEIAGDERIDAKQTDKDLANIDWLYNRILGRPDPSQLHPAATYLRMFRKLNFLRLMGQVGFAQIQDFSSGVGQLGLRAVLSHSPAFRRVINMDGESVLKHGLDREMEALIGRDPLQGLQHWRDEDFAPALPGALGKLDNGLNVAQQIMSKVSGLDLVNTALQRMMSKAIVQKFADLAGNATKANIKRMLSIGIDEPMLQRILTQTQHFTKEDGAVFKGKVTHMNLHNWTDHEARAAFENGLFRWTRRVVQQNDYGAMHRWSSNPLWQMIFQFRSFALGAWEKQFLHNVQMKDWQSFHMMWMSMALGAATYAVRTNVQAIGRSDREDFLKQRLAVPNLAGAAFQLAGWSSIMPMAWDSGLRLGGLNPWFDFRTSGQATDALLGNPTVDFVNSFGNAMKGTKESFKTNRPMSQQELRNWTRVAPFGNWAPAVPLLNSMIANRAPYAPR